MNSRPNRSPRRGALADLHHWAISLPTDPWGEHLYVVVEQLVRDLLDDWFERVGR
jgi:hypothetical protein